MRSATSSGSSTRGGPRGSGLAARFWTLVLACQLLIAAGAGGMASLLPDPSHVTPVLVAIAVCGAIPLAAVAASLAAARSGAPRPGVTPGAGGVLRLICTEAIALDIAILRMAAERLLPPPDIPPAACVRHPRPVLLVHGIACNRAVWRPLIARLRAAGFAPVRAVSLEPLFGDIDSYAAALLGEVDAVRRSAGGRPIAIVAHSMGGLVARAALRRAAPGVIDHIVTIGTPHHGTTLACRFGWPSTRQMCRGSGWLRDLNAEQERRLAVPVTSLYSLDDNLVAPPTSAVLEDARALELRGPGHLGLLRSPRVLEAVVSELRAC